MNKRLQWLMVAGLIALIFPTFLACGTAAPAVKPASMPAEPTSTLAQEGKPVHYQVQLTNKKADGYIIPIGKVNIVCVVTDTGMVGCGAFDVMALDSYKYPAVKVKSSTGGSIATIDDLLAGVVKEVNNEASKLGIKIGMTGREALDLL